MTQFHPPILPSIRAASRYSVGRRIVCAERRIILIRGDVLVNLIHHVLPRRQILDRGGGEHHPIYGRSEVSCCLLSRNICRTYERLSGLGPRYPGVSRISLYLKSRRDKSKNMLATRGGSSPNSTHLQWYYRTPQPHDIHGLVRGTTGVTDPHISCKSIRLCLWCQR